MLGDDRVFVEWWAPFDCDNAARDERQAFYRVAFGGWLESLRRHMSRLAVTPP